MAQPRRSDLAIEERVVDRVEHTVSDAREHRAGQQHPVALRERITESGDTEEPQTDEQHRARPQLVDDETRRCLDQARDDEERSENRAQLHEPDVELFFEPRKQWCEDQLAEMADGMPEADETDELRVVLQTSRG